MDNQNKSDKYDTFFDPIDAKFCEYYAVRSNIETLGCFDQYDSAEQYAKEVKARKPFLNITIHKVIEVGTLLKEMPEQEGVERTCENCMYNDNLFDPCETPYPCNCCHETFTHWRPK